MKKTASVFLILLIMVSAFATFAYIGVDQKIRDSEKTGNSDKDVSTAGTDSVSSLDETEKKIVAPDGDLFLQVGQSRQCRLQFEDGSPAEGAFWSSSDEKIARVSTDGRVTAVAQGETELLAVLGKDSKVRVKVSVCEDLAAAATGAILRLATDGSDEAMKQVDAMAQSFSHAGDKSTADLGAMMQALTAFRQAGEKGDSSAPQLWDALKDAVRNTETGLNNQQLRQAALAAYSQGEKSSSELTITFTGDCTLAYYNETRYLRGFPAVYKKSGSLTYPFDLTREVFGADDITMINFEGTLTDYTNHKNKQFFFRGEPSFADILPASSIEAVTLENNHSYDYLDIGYSDTIDNIKKVGVAYTNYDTPAVINVKGLRVVMISLCLFETDFSDEMLEHVQNYVNMYKQKDTIIVMNAHWGIERDKNPDSTQIKAAHAMIDAGVDLVIGHHPHVPQGIEVYNGHYIFYSLGNFAFGGNAKANQPETLMVRAMFGRDDEGNAALSRVSVIPCLTTSTGTDVNNYRPTPLYGEKAAKVMEKLLQLSSQVDGGVGSLTWSMIP